MNNPKGSLWRKWDLQVHAPGTKLADGYKIKGASEDEIWSVYLELLRKSDVEVFGITDYFSISSYEELLKRIKGNNNFNNKVFFPNIEFRLDLSLNQSTEQLQTHLIFDNNCSVERIKNFLSRLPLVNKKPDGSRAYCVETDILECGGYDKVSVSKTDLLAALDDSFGDEKPFLLIGIASGMGSLRAPNQNIKKELADLFDKDCDLFFGNASNTGWFLQLDRYENKKIVSEPKPVLAASDCHSFKDIEDFLGKAYVNKDGVQEKDVVWIKADKTFNGLKQVTYEPEERVRFGYEKPDEKKSYFTIDKVRFIDNSPDDNFPPELVEINPNLTGVIGGKSTGKSLLLFYIAKTIDLEEVERRFADHPAATSYTFDEDPNFNFEVTWGDGQKTLLKPVSGAPDQGGRKILYIPQNYLNKLSEKNIKSRETLNKFVKDVLLQDEGVREKYEASMLEVKNLLRGIPIGITNLYQLISEISEIEELIKELGEEAGIRKYLEQLQKDADEIKKVSGLKQQEIEQYEKLLEKDRDITTRISVLEEDRKNLVVFQQLINQQVSGLEELRDERISYLGSEDIKEEFSKEFAGIKDVKTSLLASTTKIIKSIDSKNASLKKDLETVKKELHPFMAKVKLQSELSKKIDAIKQEEAKLNKIGIEKKNLEAKKVSFEKEKSALITTYKSVFGVYETVKNEFTKYENKFEDISLNVQVSFDEQRFNMNVVADCMNKADLKLLDGATWKDEYEYKYDPIKHNEFITKVFEGLLSGKIHTTRNRSSKEAIVKLLEDYFGLDFRISYKNDPLDRMSPGKKSLVLLRLLIDLSDEEWPILLDQPEDDLDNRSVYDDLVSFMKKKKSKRQIIIVTHNPNLVVGADAEEIIVANQEGQEKSRENRKFKFEYVSGSLENTYELPESEEKAVLYRKGIREHVCEVLEGGVEAFRKRESKYGFRKN